MKIQLFKVIFCKHGPVHQFVTRPLVEAVKCQVIIADLEFQFIRYKILIKGVLFVDLGKLLYI